MELTARLEQSPCIQRPGSPNAPGSWGSPDTLSQDICFKRTNL